MSKKIVVITGAAVPGYGQAITEKYLSEGYTVIGTYLSDDTDVAQSFSGGKPSLFMHEVNLDKLSDLECFSKKIGQQNINCIVFAQFYWNMESLSEFDHELFNKSMSFNVNSFNYLVHELKDRITQGGSIVIITSTEGLIGSFGSSAYAAARAAQHNLVKTFANTLGVKQVRVNALAAGWVGSVMDTDDIFNLSRDITPLSRLGKGEEIAETSFFLTSEKSSFTSGATLIVDGGYSCVDAMAKYEYEDSLK